MRLIICFCQLGSEKYLQWYGIEERDLPAINCAEIESVASDQKLQRTVVQAVSR